MRSNSQQMHRYETVLIQKLHSKSASATPDGHEKGSIVSVMLEMSLDWAYVVKDSAEQIVSYILWISLVIVFGFLLEVILQVCIILSATFPVAGQVCQTIFDRDWMVK